MFTAAVFLYFVHIAWCTCELWASEDALHSSCHCYIMDIVVCQCQSSQGVLGGIVACG